MTKAKVYMTDFRVPVGLSLPEKLKRLCRRAGMEKEIDFEGKYTAIKMHFGELGNLASLRPQYVHALADLVKEAGGLPFLTDCNTLYPGSRKNALEHLECAALNGYNPITTGCQVLIGDGLRGTDEVEVPVPGGEYIKKQRSAALSWMLTSSSVWRISRATNQRVLAVHQEYRHGLRKPGRQDGAALFWKTCCR